MFKTSLLISFLFFSYLVEAQYPGYVLIKDSETFKKSFALAAGATQTIQSGFTQEKTLAMLSEKINSTGNFWFQKKDKLRMEYIRPYSYIMILNEGKIYVKDGIKENRVSANSSKVYQQINRILLDCVAGKMLENTDFDSRVFESDRSWLVECKPRAKNLKALYKSINIVIDKKDYSATAIEMYEYSGDKTILRFQNKEINAQIPDSIFTIP